MTSEALTRILAERVMHWTVAPDRFLKDGRRWLPAWRFQPLHSLENAVALLDAAEPSECTIFRQQEIEWAVTLTIGDRVGKTKAPSLARAITLAVAQAISLDVSECE
jgi:hypothetical protein